MKPCINNKLIQFFRKPLLILLTGCALLSGCTQPRDLLNEQLLAAVRSDQQFDEQEFGEAQKFIEENAGELPMLVKKDGKIDTEKFPGYLTRLAATEKMALDPDDIWLPDAERNKKFGVNVYLENSASIEGYVKGTTQFENALYALLSDLKHSQFCTDLNLSYINSQVTGQVQNAGDKELDEFIRKLEPEDFRKRGGNRTASDISSVMETALNSVDETHAALLITDAVFSPGKKNPDAAEYLTNQKVRLKGMFQSRLMQQKRPVSVLFLRLESEFTGTYYDRYNDKHELKACIRPYYLVFIASPVQMQQLLSVPDIATV
ncbi:MAG: hypothetical protein ACRC3B_06110, partial [Bacteroidia bacterium]